MQEKKYIYIIKIATQVIDLIKDDSFSIVIEAINEVLDGNEKVLRVIKENKQFSDLVDFINILEVNKTKIIVLSKTEHLLAS